ncbi:MAG: [cytidine(C)-cytidine(C)-adenosine (A)]-adding enzyme [Myxococcaceae bacterium]|nr:[cytidine(C)-cytidine(C)-adenosine (A)]-adding enzyme [Myxococcaceae bacterium]
MLLERAVVPPAVLEVVQGLVTAGHEAFLVGGCVRDILREQPPKDFDIATSARPEEVQRAFRRVIPTGIEHGTVTVVVRGVHVEVTTFRAEADYLDGRRPSKVEFHTDIEADLSRRDFTINAMAWDPVGKRLVDPFGGRDDLASRTIRCVRSAMERFLEDGLRAMRAVRFATVLDFAIAPETEAAIPQTLHVFRKVAMERINQEFTRLLLAPHVAQGLTLTRRTGLLGQFLPEAEATEPSAVARAPADLAIRLAVLLHHAAGVKDVVLRLKYPVKVATDTAHLVEHLDLPAADAPDAQLRRWLATVKPEHAPSILDAAGALGGSVATLMDRSAALIASNPPLSTKALALNGGQIMKVLNVGPSPIVGQATAFLLDRVLDEPSLNTPAALESLLAGWKPPA